MRKLPRHLSPSRRCQPGAGQRRAGGNARRAPAPQRPACAGHAVARQEDLSQVCLERIEKVERVIPKMQATLECVSGAVRQQGSQLALPQPASYAMHAPLRPLYSLECGASTRTVTAGAPLHALAERLRTPLLASDGVFGTLSLVEQETLKIEAAKLAEVFQRSSSKVAGRQGALSLRNHHRRGHDHPRKRACLTAVPNFFLTRVADVVIKARVFVYIMPSQKSVSA